jgi:succinate-semialdehyde dehydrogenase/glutarate-semialdehyde dehydrogenase
MSIVILKLFSFISLLTMHANASAHSLHPPIYPNTRLMINNRWIDAVDGKTMTVINPATNLEIARLAHAGVADLNYALSAAAAGFEVWRKVSAVDRGKMMRIAAEILRTRAPVIAELMTQEQGKPVLEARAEVMAAAEIIEFMSDEGRRIYGRIVPSRNHDVQNTVYKEPVGVVAAFTPWNFPINQIARKLSAALAAGCSIIVKAPEETPASPAAFIQAFIDAGIPAGVIGLVYGTPAEISNYLIAHPIVRHITFTGSAAVGKQLAALAGSHMKPCTMELGGHAPVIVAEDADINIAIKGAAAAKFRNAGQACIAPSRFLVHRTVKDAFKEALLSYTRHLVVGNGLAEGTTLGPLANTRRVAAMQAFTSNALQCGATLLAGGERMGILGNFFAPTILDNVPTTADVFNQEPFGPIVSMRTFDVLDEAIAEANRLSYGLAAYGYTRSLKTAHRLSTEMQVGMLWINQAAMAWPELPFGGMKDSGYGSEGGPEALNPYLNTRIVSIAV